MRGSWASCTPYVMSWEWYSTTYGIQARNIKSECNHERASDKLKRGFVLKRKIKLTRGMVISNNINSWSTKQKLKKFSNFRETKEKWQLSIILDSILDPKIFTEEKICYTGSYGIDQKTGIWRAIYINIILILNLLLFVIALWLYKNFLFLENTY